MQIFIPVLILSVIGLIAAVGLALASKFLAVPTDEREAKIRECLPGANCGACGFSGCDGYAAALAAGEAEPNKCAPGGETVLNELCEMLGANAECEQKVAFIACKGNREISKSKYAYSGLQSCAAANLLHKGPLECEFGCIGFGDCVAACPFGAISLENGKPVVCVDICSGCGACAKVCPKGIINIVPKAQKTLVGCSNLQKGAKVVKDCAVSCIACGMCVKQCEKGAIKIENNLAVIDYTLCDNCGKCKTACKRNVL